MAYMNFNTGTKFWSTLCVQAFDSMPTVTDKGCIAFNNAGNNGMMSINGETSGTYEWKPIVHTVEKGPDSNTGEVTQTGGTVTISFPKDSSGGTGNCTKKTIVSNISIGSTSISSIIVPLPDTFDNTSSFLMTTVYEVNDKGGIQSELKPEVSVVNSDSSFGVKFYFEDSISNKILKVMILFDKTADQYDSSVFNEINWELYNASTNIEVRTPDTKIKNAGA